MHVSGGSAEATLIHYGEESSKLVKLHKEK